MMWCGLPVPSDEEAVRPRVTLSNGEKSLDQPKVGGILQDHWPGSVKITDIKRKEGLVMPLFREDVAARCKMVSGVDPGLEREYWRN